MAVKVEFDVKHIIALCSLCLKACTCTKQNHALRVNTLLLIDICFQKISFLKNAILHTVRQHKQMCMVFVSINISLFSTNVCLLDAI